MTVTPRHVKALELTLPGWEFAWDKPYLLYKRGEFGDWRHCRLSATSENADHLCASLERAWLGMGYGWFASSQPDGGHCTGISKKSERFPGYEVEWTGTGDTKLEAYLDAAVEVMVALGRME